ncbi:esterase/lipase family protein [Luteolibacter soli]|uniref:AB hydrolase-1 domain-containing protein n=1 Tax=Luteolibacter soli TaxID=3135280 RepID=A0ABU9B2H5_9BACT
MIPNSKRLLTVITAALTLWVVTSCAWQPRHPRVALSDSIRNLDFAYRRLPQSLPAYNTAMREVCETLSARGSAQATRDLGEAGVDFSQPHGGLAISSIDLPLSHPVPETGAAGVPIVLKYEPPPGSLYPPEGLFVNGTAIYEREDGRGKVSIITGSDMVRLGNHRYQAAIAPLGAGERMGLLGKKFARSGFKDMLRPLASVRKPKIYLLDPYDPDKIPLLMVHGLQSTPLAFSAMVDGLRGNPEFRSKYQIWQFHYPSGTPVLENAASLRASLSATIAKLDPQGTSVACHHIVLLGHSMGGVISHTLVSSSGDDLWSSIFTVPASELSGDRETIRYLDHVLHFERDPRIARVVFMAAPHQGSPVSTSVVGAIGNMLTRLSPMEEFRISRLAADNSKRMRPEAATFYGGGRFSSIRTLSPKAPALIALSRRPIHIPFHSIIAQESPGPMQEGSDGVVPYWSSHLPGARSEKVVRSGHSVLGNPDAIREVSRILLEE